MPIPLRENWLSIYQREYSVEIDRLDRVMRDLEWYEHRMDDAGYHNPGHRRLLQDTINLMRHWCRLLRWLPRPMVNQIRRVQAAPGIQLVDRDGTFAPQRIPGQTYFETGVIGQQWNLGDIRKKRFVNSGVMCNECRDGERDHPQLTGCDLFEFFSF